MHQLQGERVADADDALVHELFLQCLLANVRVVLASSPDIASLDDLAQLADRIVDAASPTIAGVTAPSSPEVEQLRAEVSRLADIVTSLTHDHQPRHRSPTPRRRHRPPTPRCSPPLLVTLSAGTMSALAVLHANVNLHAKC